jgi:beta-glucosidase
MTFPQSADQLPRAVRPGTGLADKQMFSIDYPEGAAVGYKWFDARKLKPLFPFGHGLSYTRFTYGPASARANGDGTVSVSFPVTNAGQRAGSDVAQVYVAPAGGGWEAPKRLGGYAKVNLAPGASQRVSVTIDPRLLATFDGAAPQWRIAPGSYRVMVGESSADIRSEATVNLPALTLPSNWRPGQVAAAPTRNSGERGR